MFSANSRYSGLPTYTVVLGDGRSVTATTLPAGRSAPLLGYHPRIEGDRLDLLAARYLKEPTGFWRLCDAGNAMVPDSLNAADLVGVPLDASVRS